MCNIKDFVIKSGLILIFLLNKKTLEWKWLDDSVWMWIDF